MERRKRVALLTLATAVLFGGLSLRCCCRPPAATPQVTPVVPSPIAGLTLEPPRDIPPNGPTATRMHNVDFRVDPVIVLHISDLQGDMRDLHHGPLDFDDKRSFVLTMKQAVIGIEGTGIAELMNHYVFGYPGASLRDLHITIANGVMMQEGILHKGIDIPFQMKAQVSATSDGQIRVHPTEIRICDLNGKKLMAALGISLQRMVDTKRAKGVKVVKNDLLIEPLTILPPPRIDGVLKSVELRGDRMVQTFGGASQLGQMEPPEVADSYMYFRGGMLQMGKLFMPQGDMEVVDTDRSDPFDFFLDRYNDQLVAGFTRNRPDFGLTVHMRDYSDLASPPRPGEQLAP